MCENTIKRSDVVKQIKVFQYELGQGSTVELQVESLLDGERNKLLGVVREAFPGCKVTIEGTCGWSETLSVTQSIYQDWY